MLKLQSSERVLFCGESFMVECWRTGTYAIITFKCLSGRYTLQVYNNGTFEFNFPLNSMWNYDVKNLLEKEFFRLIKLAC